MKRKMKLLIWFTTLCMVLIGVIAISNDAQASESDFVIENGVLTKYTGSGGDVVIPDGVSSIGKYAFTDVDFSGAIASISGCSTLISLTIPDGVTSIGESAFGFCNNLTDVIIPNSVTEIGYKAFEGTPWLESKRKERSDHLVIGGNVLIEGVKASGKVVIPNGITSISDYAFYFNDSLTSIVIPDSVIYIGDYVFGHCSNLQEATILNPKAKLSGYELYGAYNILVGPDARTEFKNPVIIVKGYKYSTTQELVDCMNKYWYRDSNTTFKFVELDGTGGNTPKPSVTPKPNKPKTPNKGTILKSKNITYKVTKKGSEVAYTKISGTSTSVNIPNTVKIGGITYKITSVSANAFKGNKKLSKVAIGANITSIGKNVFSGCKNLKTITIKSTKLKSVGQNAFKGIKSTARIKVPSKQLKAYKKLLKGKGQGKKVRITK